MNTRSSETRLGALDRLNFVLTNRVPRALLTRLMGRFSRIRQPLVRDLSIALWQRFGDLDLRDAKKSRFDSVHDCFTRELRDGARPIDADPDVLASPCDAIVGACGPVFGADVFQAKGLAYRLAELLNDDELAHTYRDGCYATLRLTAGMYHRFHAPHDCTVEQVTLVPGDLFNVNPPAVALIERLYCRNERAVIRCRLRQGAELLTLVPVAAILVGSIRLHFVDLLLHRGYRGPQRIDCAAALSKGAEMGWFEHGSTLLVFAPKAFALCDSISAGARIRMGQRLMRRLGD
jgi:phosphatidylserine decarboxylase